MKQKMTRVLAVLLVVAGTAAAKGGPAAAEAKLKSKIAVVWVDYARFLKIHGRKEDAKTALEEARAADPDVSGLDRLAKDVENLPEGGGDKKGLAKRRAKAHKDLAKQYDKLAGIEHAPEDAARFEGYLFRAVDLEPSKSRIGKVAGRIRKLAGNRKTSGQAGRLLVRLREADPDGTAKGRYDKLEIELALKDLVLIKSPDHPMVGYLSLPKSWSKKRSYPILVTVDGAGSNFSGAGRNFARSRGSRNFLVLAPCSLSNTNALGSKKYPFYAKELLDEHNRNRIAFDLEGLAALLKVLRTRFGGQEEIGITGFSGGGNLCYAWTVTHAETILFSAPACANYSGMGFNEAKPVDGLGPPLHIMTGELDPHRDFTFGKKDSPGIEPQTDAATNALEQLGYKNVRRTMLKGVKHSSCAKQVWAFSDEVRGE